MSLTAYEVRNLTKQYKRNEPLANDGISLDVYQGEVFGLLGPNGAGKTTLIRQICGLLQPTSGSISLFGHDIVREPQRAADWIALQPQGQALPRAECTRTLVELTGELRGLPRATAQKEAVDLLEELGLKDHATKRFQNLSGGLRRLASIAVALIGHRSVLIFDEPTNDLDPEIRRVVWTRIRQAAREGSAVVLVTHNVVEAEQALDRVAIVRAGRILVTGSPLELKARVERQVRVDLVFRPEFANTAEHVLARWPVVHSLGARRYSVVVPRSEAEGAMGYLLPHLDNLDDFRIVTPNLEDVYIQLSGGERLGN